MANTRPRRPLIKTTAAPDGIRQAKPNPARPALARTTSPPAAVRTPAKRVVAAKPTAPLKATPTLRVVPDPESMIELPPPPAPSANGSVRVVRTKGLRKAPKLATESWVAPLLDPFVDDEVDEKVRQVITNVNEYGFDPWGLNPLTARYGYSFFKWLYRNYWRVDTFGIENVPSGRVLLIGNHSGQVPIDGVMVAVAMLLEGKPPRLVRAMIERWFGNMPLVGEFVSRLGGIIGDPVNCERLLHNGEAVMVFPEGARGSGKIFRDRYKLVRFGLGFMRLALKTNTPIVPFGVVGGEEQAPSLMDFKPAAKLLGLPYFPITPTFPWLGVLGMVPYPTKYRIYFGEPLTFRGAPDDRDEVIQRKVNVVKRSIRQLIDRGLEERQSIWF